MSLIEEVEAIKADKSLSHDEQKKKIRKLRRQSRKAGNNPVIEKTPINKTLSNSPRGTLDEYVATIEKFFEGYTLLDAKKPGYSFSLRQAYQLTIADPSVFISKFKARWAVEPTEARILKLPAGSILLLGPVPLVR